MNQTPHPTSQNTAEVSTPPILRILLLRVFVLFFLDLVLNSKSPNPLYLPRTRLSSSCNRKQLIPSAKTHLSSEAHGGDVMTWPGRVPAASHGRPPPAAVWHTCGYLCTCPSHAHQALEDRTQSQSSVLCPKPSVGPDTE